MEQIRILIADDHPLMRKDMNAIPDLLAQGYPNPRIAQELNLSSKTVGNYISIIFDKLQVADRSEAIIRAREAGPGRTST